MKILTKLLILLTILIPNLSFAMEHGISEEEITSPISAKKRKITSVKPKGGVNNLSEESSSSSGESAFKVCPKEIKVMILHIAAIDECLNNRRPVNILLVCREWRKLIDEESIAGKTVKRLCQEAWYGVPGHEEIYERFLKGVLIYRPQEGSEVGMITMRISELLNPLGSSFDLSQCGNSGKYLSIATGYRKGKKAENAHKLEVWIAPRFLIEKNLVGSASHFKPIMSSWNVNKATIGLFYTGGGFDNLGGHDHLISQNPEQLSTENLYKYSIQANVRTPECDKYERAICCGGGRVRSQHVEKFHIHFELK